MFIQSAAKFLLAGTLLLAGLTVLPGCDDKEKILDIETPNTDIEVERDKDNGKIDIDTD